MVEVTMKTEFRILDRHFRIDGNWSLSIQSMPIAVPGDILGGIERSRVGGLKCK